MGVTLLVVAGLLFVWALVAIVVVALCVASGRSERSVEAAERAERRRLDRRLVLVPRRWS